MTLSRQVVTMTLVGAIGGALWALGDPDETQPAPAAADDIKPRIVLPAHEPARVEDTVARVMPAHKGSPPVESAFTEERLAAQLRSASDYFEFAQSVLACACDARGLVEVLSTKHFGSACGVPESCGAGGRT
ncbi:MAG: hypothetical protein IRZ28_15725 [Steroidobacteraceae bacterium]|nr:hypothetical protein [Steroidobacteraceae bacterium]